MLEEERIRLIVTGDDFGKSKSVNDGILRAHSEGILTAASLMVNERYTRDAVEKAQDFADLAVGLHLTLVQGRSCLKPSEIIGMVDNRFQFDSSPIRAGLRYFFFRSLRTYICQEMDAQIRRFNIFGFPLDHINGHLNFHLHPTVFSLLKRHAKSWDIPAVRLTRDPLLENLRLDSGKYFSRLTHACIFSLLSRGAGSSLSRRGIRHTDAVYGLLQSGRITEKYLLRLINSLKPGTYELYAHPDESEHIHETNALCSPKVRDRIEELGIELIAYRDLYEVQTKPVQTTLCENEVFTSIPEESEAKSLQIQ